MSQVLLSYEIWLNSLDKLSVELNCYHVLRLDLSETERETFSPLPAFSANITNPSCPLSYSA